MIAKRFENGASRIAKIGDKDRGKVKSPELIFYYRPTAERAHPENRPTHDLPAGESWRIDVAYFWLLASLLFDPGER